MSEDADETPGLPAPPLPAGRDFETVAALLALIASPRDCGRRLRDLAAAEKAAHAAQRKLAEERAAHDAFIAKERGELEVRSTALRERELKVHAAEGLLAAHEAIYAEQKAALDRRQNRVQHFPGGMTRDLPVGHSDEIPVEDQQVRDDDFHAVAGTTISRSKPRHTMRRIQDI